MEHELSLGGEVFSDYRLSAACPVRLRKHGVKGSGEGQGEGFVQIYDLQDAVGPFGEELDVGAEV